MGLVITVTPMIVMLLITLLLFIFCPGKYKICTYIYIREYKLYTYVLACICTYICMYVCIFAYMHVCV